MSQIDSPHCPTLGVSAGGLLELRLTSLVFPIVTHVSFPVSNVPHRCLPGFEQQLLIFKGYVYCLVYFCSLLPDKPLFCC